MSILISIENFLKWTDFRFWNWNFLHDFYIPFIFRNKFLAEHRKSHLDAEGNLPCPQCEKSCPNYTEMAKHMHAIHNVGPIYECMQCDWKNKNKQLYNKHMNTAHVDKSDKKFICDQVCLSFQRNKLGVLSKMWIPQYQITINNTFKSLTSNFQT